MEECARRLLQAAIHHGVPKYIAVAHKLLAEVAIARGDLTSEVRPQSAEDLLATAFQRMLVNLRVMVGE